MSTVQISPNSVLMKPTDINPLANVSSQHPINKSKEQNNKDIDQVKADIVTISQEAIAKNLELSSSAMETDKKATIDSKMPSKPTHLQSTTNAEESQKSDAASFIDKVMISAQASLKSLVQASVIKSITEAAFNKESESAVEKLGI